MDDTSRLAKFQTCTNVCFREMGLSYVVFLNLADCFAQDFLSAVTLLQVAVKALRTMSTTADARRQLHHVRCFVIVVIPVWVMLTTRE